MMNIQLNADDDGNLLLLSDPNMGNTCSQFVDKQGGGNPLRKKKRKVGAVGEELIAGNTILSKEQMHVLEQSFQQEQKLETERKERLAAQVGLQPRQVAVWFQNRRARWKAKKLEEEFFDLKSRHDAILMENTLLECEVLMLKGQLREAQDQISWLTELSDHGSLQPNPTSSPDCKFGDCFALEEFFDNHNNKFHFLT